MVRFTFSLFCAACFVSWLVESACNANIDTIGPNGINSSTLGLNGNDIPISQLELGRPGLPGFDSAEFVHNSVVPTAVYFRDGAPLFNVVSSHAENVAGIMISSHATLTGVAPNADLASSGFTNTGTIAFDPYALSLQLVSIGSYAVNHSYGVGNSFGDPFDGNSQYSLALDWSAKRYNTLHVMAGNEGNASPFPQDAYNGMVIGASSRIAGVWRQVANFNTFDEDPEGLRTAVSLIAPGDGFSMTDLGSVSTIAPHPAGTSFAAPHVTGTVALLQQYAAPRINMGAPRWNATSPKRHEVMKAVLMNSADKLIDDGTIVVNGNTLPRGRLLGMDRTVVSQTAAGSYNWLASEAYNGNGGDDWIIPVDIQMGAGHLNARRALQQFRNGEYNSDGASVPVIGWDFGTTSGLNDLNKYKINQKLLGGSFVSVMIAFDRLVRFETDNGTPTVFNAGDTFEPYSGQFPLADDVISDLDIYLMPANATNLNQRIDLSISPDSTIDHIFFQIPSTGNYEIWVHQFDADIGPQDYGIAWWAVSGEGDYNQDLNWNCTDVNTLSTAIATGSTNTIYDLNRDGLVSLLDITDLANGWLSIAGAINTAATSGLPFLNGDANLDGSVDASDFGIWNGNKFTFNTDWCSGDFNADAVIDSSDFGIWNSNKFQSSSSVTIVPEPLTTVQFVMLLIAVHFRTSRQKSR